MRKTILACFFTPVFLLALVAQYALACCIDNDQDGYVDCIGNLSCYS